MIVYGTRASHLKSDVLKDESCPQCEEKGSLLTSIFGRYAHVFWIPFFPIGKVGVSQCQKCGVVIEQDAMPSDVSRASNSIKLNAKTPIWNFAGIFLVLIFSVYMYFDNVQTKNLEADFLTTPQSGDVYYYKTDGGMFSALKVVSVSTDSIEVFQNQYETDMKSGMDEVDVEENYMTVPISVARKNIEEMYKSEKIFEINRN